jgi:hypothetical protein
MTAMRTILFGTLSILLVYSGSGCSTLIKRGAKEALGASSDVDEVPGTVTVNFSRFNGVDVAPPRSDLGGLVHAKFRDALVKEIYKRLTEAEEPREDEEPKPPLFSGGSPVLRIEPYITWYHKSKGLGSMLGKDSYAVAIFWLKDGGMDVGRVQVVTKSEAMRTGHDDLAKSMAKGLAKYFKKRRGD